MIQLLLGFFLMVLMQSVQCADLSGVNAAAVVDWAQYAWTSGVLGVILITLGIFLTFAGKRWFKPFLGISGFLTFGVLSLSLLTWVDQVVAPIPSTLYVVLGVSILAGLLGAWLCFTMWEIGVLASAGFGGYSLGVWLMSMKSGLLIEGYVGRSVFITSLVCAAIILAWFFDELAVVIASSISGSLALVIGVDCFLHWGLIEVLLAQLSPKNFGKLSNVSTKVYIELGCIAGIAVLGAVVQFFTGTARKGFGRSDRV